RMRRGAPGRCAPQRSCVPCRYGTMAPLWTENGDEAGSDETPADGDTYGATTETPRRALSRETCQTGLLPGPGPAPQSLRGSPAKPVVLGGQQWRDLSLARGRGRALGCAALPGRGGVRVHGGRAGGTLTKHDRTGRRGPPLPHAQVPPRVLGRLCAESGGPTQRGREEGLH